MPYIVVENFKGGLDTRRHKLSSAPGTLTSLVNAHVTRGGEIEKRKAFHLAYTLPAGTFGLETGSGQVYVFGSADLAAQMPAGVTYQRLVSPDGAANSMTKAIYSTVYGGKPFVIAQFANGQKYPFWDGAYIKDFSSGIVTAAMMNNAGIAAHLASVFSYTNDENQPYSIQVINGNKLRIIGPPGVAFEGSMIKNSNPAVDGIVVQNKTDPTPDKTAKGSFVVLNGSSSDRATMTYALRQHNYPGLPNAIGVWVSYPDGSAKELLGFPAPLPPPVILTCSTVDGSLTVTTADTTGITVGMTVAGNGIPDLAKVAALWDDGTNKGFTLTAGHEATEDQTDVSLTLRQPVIATIQGFGAWSMAGGIGGDPGQRYAAAFSTYVNANSGNTGYSASYWHGGGGWNKWDPGSWTLYAPQEDYEKANGRSVWIEFAAQPGYPGSTGGNPGDNFFSYAADTIMPSPYYRVGEDRSQPTGRWIMKTMGYTNGVLAGGTFNGISSVTVDGVEVLGSRVPWATSNSSLALNTVTQINTYLSTTEYTASVSNNTTVTIATMQGAGASGNGRSISATPVGSVTLSAFSMFAGGTDLVQAAPQIMEFEIKDPFTVGDKYSIIIVDPASPNQPYQFGFNRVGGVQPLFSATYKGKEYLASGSTLYFSKLNDATKWGVYELGSGFIDMSNNFGGREDLTGFGAYQGQVAVFTRRNCQLWFFDPNPAQNAQRQILDNTGCIAPGSVVSVGAIDLFYLADNGIRSLRARENTDAAYANDIGSPVDQLVIEHMRTMTEADKYDAKAVIEPEDGRYWLALGSRLFVLSSFAGSGINAWSEYEPGFTVEEFASMENKVYARSHDEKIYIYGGHDGTLYDASPVSVEIPYLDANKPATFKSVNGLDVTCEGGWKFFIGFDYTNPTAKDEIASMNQPSFALGRIPVAGYGTHVGVKAVTTGSGYAKLANAIVHYDDQHSKHEAG
ncbi:hypothetical protein UFOVP807_14 [uncultured Caudovirales phage]|uniref:Uncharacterized protein n=1 Tax=uncultured Caudovirales phage TaxID=2100421 RepID=A0A6J5P269_9CAUD|nr:hypothetical protein UFOVP339_27 [uncultured Caudovirales phage]CAB4163418.1 hypothetical protein UFOVP807_14 [uncultured Caudovirales phage]